MFGRRIRRIKCDESKPACVKCTSTGRICDGYAIKPNAPDPPEDSQLVPVRARSIPDELSVGISENRAESRGFHFFQTYVCPQLSSELHSVFWERLILQTSHADTAIRHAAIAFGALGERLLMNNVMTFGNEDANKLHDFASFQYYKALQALRKQLSSGQERSVEFTLIICFIFICFEFLQGNESAVVTHLRSGISIVRQYKFRGVQFDPDNPSAPPTEPVDFGYHVAILFSTLDISAGNWMATPSFGMPVPIVHKLDYRSPLLEGFPNTEKAEEYLDNLCTQLHRVLPAWAFVPSDSDISPKFLSATTPLVEGLFSTLDNWLRAMDAFMARSQHEFSVHELRKATILILHHRVATLRLTACCQVSEEEFYRESECDFNYIISMSTSLCQPIDATIKSRDLGSGQSHNLFSFQESIIYPLYFTAVHCHKPEIQNEALSMLSTSPWREGAWDSAAMARIAERSIRHRKQKLLSNMRH